MGKNPTGSREYALVVDVTFRPLVDDDLPMLHRWLNEPEVVRWWEGNDVSWEAVVADYGSGNVDPVEHWIASAGGKDIGSAMIRAFVVDVVFGLHPDWTQACASPYAANVASWRALEKAGFRFVGIVEDKDGPSRLMVTDRSTALPRLL